MDLITILISTFLISLKCFTISLTLPDFFKLKEIEESLVEVEKEHSPAKEEHNLEGDTRKPTVEMTRHLRPLYVRAHFNGKPVFKVLVDNRSIVNVIPLRMLRALGRGIGDLIETEVFVLAFTREISKTLGILPIDITVGIKTSLSTFFVINW